MQAFQERKTRGLDLSDHIWQVGEQYRAQIETAIDVALTEGRTVQELSRDVRGLLLDPDKLFRRVRDKHGKLVPSKAMKAFSPGAGKYKSSYKNALRLARTEVNMAYRTADLERWRAMDFILGYEVKRSTKEQRRIRGAKGGVILLTCPLCDLLQGRYPKSFQFVGWHPQCLCYCTPILEEWDSRERREDFQQRLVDALEGRPPQTRSIAPKAGEVTDVPEGFKRWQATQLARLAEDKRLWARPPYFVRDNFVEGDIAKGLKLASQATAPPAEPSALERARTRQAQRTPAQIADIQARWDARRIRNMEDLFPEAEYYASTYSVDDMQRIYKATKEKLASLEGLSLEERHKALEKEIQRLEALIKKGKGRNDILDIPWDTYRDEKRKVEYKIEVGKLAPKMQKLEKFVASGKGSKELEDLVAYLKKSIEGGQHLDGIKTKLKEAEAERKRIVEASKLAKSGGAFSPDAYTKKRKDKAIWDTGDGMLADRTLIDTASKNWRTATKDEKDKLYEYTYRYENINKPLQGRKYSKRQTKRAFERRVENITSYIDKSLLPKDMWFTRGDSDMDTIASRIRFAGGEMPDNLQDLVGMTMQEGGFMSTASRKGEGFSTRPVILNVYAPKGTKAAYIEPLSAYGNGDGRSWDGLTRFGDFSDEQETLFQRGTIMRITKIYQEGYQTFIECEVIGQEVKPLSYVKDSDIGR